MDPSRFSHDESPYERPDSKFRCGRAACWGKSCARGPNVDGSCGGAGECAPFFDGEGYRCQRPAEDGGPCEKGPGPDGACGIRWAPCVPRRNLRGLRGRVTLLSFLIAVATLAALTSSGTWPMFESLDLADPGPISGAHARFTEKDGCATCHQSEDKEGLALIGEAFTGHDMSGACLDCHVFDGPAERPHNVERVSLRGPEKLECTACHSEHQGDALDMASLSDQQCQTCHRDSMTFDSFEKDHPPFGTNFPYEKPTAITFTHVRHLTKHFPSKGDKRPEFETCVSCHDIEQAGQDVPVFSFERMCAECHTDEIGRKNLVLLTLPEFDDNLLELSDEDGDTESDAGDAVPLEILEACGPVFEELARLEARLEALSASEEKPVGPIGFPGLENDQGGLGDIEDDDDFLSIGEDEPTPLEAYLLAIDPEDREAYWQSYRDLLHALTQSGVGALRDLIEARLGEGAAASLGAGLEMLPLEDLACAWAGNEEYEPEEAPSVQSGWTAEALEIRYKPSGHGDPLVRAWLESALTANGDAVPHEIAEALREALFSEKSGPGRCAVCHATTQDSTMTRKDPAEGVQIAFSSRLDWHQRSDPRHQVKYLHAPHINLFGRGTWCTNCHTLNKPQKLAANSHHAPSFTAGATASAEASAEASPAASPAATPVSSPAVGPTVAGDFTPMTVQQCKSCHKESGVRQDCMTCHLYHRGTAFKEKMF